MPLVLPIHKFMETGRRYDGRLAKRIQPGLSAAAGVKSAFYAAMGITAENIIDGCFGYRNFIPKEMTRSTLKGYWVTL